MCDFLDEKSKTLRGEEIDKVDLDLDYSLKDYN